MMIYVFIARNTEKGHKAQQPFAVPAGLKTEIQKFEENYVAKDLSKPPPTDEISENLFVYV